MKHFVISVSFLYISNVTIAAYYNEQEKVVCRAIQKIGALAQQAAELYEEDDTVVLPFGDPDPSEGWTEQGIYLEVGKNKISMCTEYGEFLLLHKISNMTGVFNTFRTAAQLSFVENTAEYKYHKGIKWYVERITPDESIRFRILQEELEHYRETDVRVFTNNGFFSIYEVLAINGDDNFANLPQPIRLVYDASISKPERVLWNETILTKWRAIKRECEDEEESE